MIGLGNLSCVPSLKRAVAPGCPYTAPRLYQATTYQLLPGQDALEARAVLKRARVFTPRQGSIYRTPTGGTYRRMG